MKKPVLRYDCVNKIKADKSTLLRIVKTPEGTIEVDPSGRMNGHGVYMAPNKETLLKAQKTHDLERALESPINDEIYEKIGRYVK